MDSSEALISKPISGQDSSAQISFDHVLNLLEERVWPYVLIKVPRADAEDVYQEVCLHAHLNLSALKAIESAKSWLFAIATRRVQDYYRAKYRQPRFDVLSESLPELHMDHIHEVEQHMNLQQLRECIAKLKQPIQEAFLLRFQVGLSLKEVAEVLQYSDETVKSWITRNKPLLFNCVRGKR